MKIRHVLFDIDNTLFPTSEFSKMARVNAVRAMMQKGLECNRANGARLLESIVAKRGSNYERHFNELVKRINGKSDLKIVAAGVMAYHNTKNSMAPYPEVPRILLNLHDEGYGLYVASEGVEIKQWDKLVRLGIDLFFRRVFVAKSKNVEFYEKIAKNVGAEPSECVMIGDRAVKDVEYAIKAGMHGIRVRRGKYKKERGDATRSVSTLKGVPQLLAKLH